MSRSLQLLLVALAGGAGAGARYLLDRLIGWRGGFPLGILVVNVTGSFTLGVLTGLGAVAGSEALLILGAGLLGGYTTFSTVSVDTAILVEQKKWRDAAANALGTFGLSTLGAAAGIALGGGLAGALSA
jgi:CrcB protein